MDSDVIADLDVVQTSFGTA